MSFTEVLFNRVMLLKVLFSLQNSNFKQEWKETFETCLEIQYADKPQDMKLERRNFNKCKIYINVITTKLQFKPHFYFISSKNNFNQIPQLNSIHEYYRLSMQRPNPPNISFPMSSHTSVLRCPVPLQIL